MVQKNPSANDVISWTFSEKFLENHSTGSQASFEWNKLLEVKEVKDGFLLYIQYRVACWLPKHAFESSEDVENFRQMVVSSGVKHGMVGKK